MWYPRQCKSPQMEILIPWNSSKHFMNSTCNSTQNSNSRPPLGRWDHPCSPVTNENHWINVCSSKVVWGFISTCGGQLFPTVLAICKKCLGFSASTFLGFKDSWFLGLKDSWCLGVKDSWFHNFKGSRFQWSLTKFPVHVFGRYCSHIQDLQDFVRRIGGISRRPSFRHVLIVLNSNILRLITILFQTCSRVFIDFVLGVLVSPKLKNWFWEPRTHPKVQKS